MGKKGSWFAAVKRAWISDSKKKDKEAQSRGDEKEKKESLDSQDAETALANPIPETVTPTEEEDDEQSSYAYSVAFATAVAAEAAVAAAQAAAEVVRLTSAARSSRKSKEEMAAIKIQSAFRGYMARRALQGLRGLVRLKSMIRERSVKQQAITTLKCMQTIAKVQSEVRARRIRMLEESRALQRQLQQKREKELEKPKIPHPGDKFDVSTHSKEQIKAKLESRQEAAKRRERALAYAYTHQMTRRNSLKSTNQTFMDPYNPQWGWSWLERWMASRPWDDRIAVIKELSSNDPATVKTTPKVNAKSSNKELSNDPLSVKTTPKVNDSKRSATPNRQNCPPASRQSPSNTASTVPVAGRLPTPQLSSKGSHENDDPRSKTSENSEHSRRHSNAEAIVRDYENIASPQGSRNRSFMAPTESTKARSSRMAARPLLYLEKRYGTPENAKKKLCSNGAPRRHSAPPAMI